MEEPEHVDKIDQESIIELYGLLGLYSRDQTYRVSIGKLERDHDGDTTNGLLYLGNQGFIDVETDRQEVKLHINEMEEAERTASKLYFERKDPGNLEQDYLPDSVSEPELQEDLNAPTLELDQNPSSEIYSRIIDSLTDDEAFLPDEVEEELAVETSFEIEPRLRYMETQNIVERVENDRYRLNPEKIDATVIRDAERTQSIKQIQRYGNDPWKP